MPAVIEELFERVNEPAHRLIVDIMFVIILAMFGRVQTQGKSRAGRCHHGESPNNHSNQGAHAREGRTSVPGYRSNASAPRKTSAAPAIPVAAAMNAGLAPYRFHSSSTA
jgi:hypothetical protein